MQTKRKYDITGDVFGTWTVLGQADHRNHKDKVLWKVVCICGQEDARTRQSLWGSRKVNDTSEGRCPHQQREYLIGKKLGKVRVLEWLGKEKDTCRDRFLCICDCGEEIVMPRSTLKYSAREELTCKECIKVEQRDLTVEKYGDAAKWLDHGELSRKYWINIVRNAAYKNLSLTIVPKDIWEIWQRQKGKCAITGWNLTMPTNESLSNTTAVIEHTASLDRIDSEKGYTKDNVQWTHKHVNLAKGDLPQQEFIDFCKLVTDYHNNPNRPVHDVIGFSS